MSPEQSKLLLLEANRCVACGLCLPHCPTYRKTGSEADSPRGRIALIRGVLEGRIPSNARYEQHIGQCLACRACELVCPSGVKYGQLVDGARAQMAGQKSGVQSSLRRALTDRVLPNSTVLRLSARLLRLSQQSGLQRWAGKLGLFAELADAAPTVPPLTVWRQEYTAQGTRRGEVALFLGCVAQVADATTLNAAIFVLTRLGYAVRVVKQQTCCGALHQHGGEPVKAAELAQRNVRAFADDVGMPIVSTASGCGATLTEYGQLAGEEGQAFALRVTDISAFLDEKAGWDGAVIQPLAAKIAVHDSCSLRNVLRTAQAPYRLLGRIPQAEIIPLPGNDQCCGSAGMYPLDQPDMAERLMSDKIAAIRESGARYIATSNIGCMLGLVKGLRAARLEVEVLHSVTLLARQMGFKEHA